MKGATQARASYRRSAKAVVIVALLIGLVPGVEAVRSLVAEPIGGERAALGIRTESLTFGVDPIEAIDAVGRAAEVGDRDLPELLADEVVVLDGARDVRIDDSESVVGYVVDGVEAHVLERLASRMEDQGWTSVPMGEVCGSTFVKQGGRCTWVLATCTQVGSAVSVVMRCVIE